MRYIMSKIKKSMFRCITRHQLSSSSMKWGPQGFFLSLKGPSEAKFGKRCYKVPTRYGYKLSPTLSVPGYEIFLNLLSIIYN